VNVVIVNYPSKLSRPVAFVEGLTMNSGCRKYFRGGDLISTQAGFSDRSSSKIISWSPWPVKFRSVRISILVPYPKSTAVDSPHLRFFQVPEMEGMVENVVGSSVQTIILVAET
jgi:hypothetical protein